MATEVCPKLCLKFEVALDISSRTESRILIHPFNVQSSNAYQCIDSIHTNYKNVSKNARSLIHAILSTCQSSYSSFLFNQHIHTLHTDTHPDKPLTVFLRQISFFTQLSKYASIYFLFVRLFHSVSVWQRCCSVLFIHRHSKSQKI